jgi:hypothetical protein
MSLSEAPVAKITYQTAQDISNEILGGAINFAVKLDSSRI